MTDADFVDHFAVGKTVDFIFQDEHRSGVIVSYLEVFPMPFARIRCGSGFLFISKCHLRPKGFFSDVEKNGTASSGFNNPNSTFKSLKSTRK